MLTVIVFTYNHGKYISKCLDSIIEQKTEYSYKVQPIRQLIFAELIKANIQS